MTFYNSQLVNVSWGADEGNQQIAHFVEYVYDYEYLFKDLHCRVMTVDRSVFVVPVSIVSVHIPFGRQRIRRVPNYYSRES